MQEASDEGSKHYLYRVEWEILRTADLYEEISIEIFWVPKGNDMEEDIGMEEKGHVEGWEGCVSRNNLGRSQVRVLGLI